MGNPIAVVFANGLTISQDASGNVTLSGAGLTATSSAGAPIIPIVSTSILSKILGVVEAALPAISTVIPAAGPIAGLVAIGIQLFENLFGKKTGPAKLQAVSGAINNAVILQHSTVPGAPPLPTGSAEAVTAMVQSAVKVYKAAGIL